MDENEGEEEEEKEDGVGENVGKGEEKGGWKLGWVWKSYEEYRVPYADLHVFQTVYTKWTSITSHKIVPWEKKGILCKTLNFYGKEKKTNKLLVSGKTLANH